MKKIPTIFERDWDGDLSRVVDKINPKAQWVFDGEGWPTRKLDGTSCMIDDDAFLWKRRELRKGEIIPAQFLPAGHDDETGKTVGWIPVEDGNEDRWHRDAYIRLGEGVRNDGTYELVGPKIQGNPEKYGAHQLVPHDSHDLRLDGGGLPRVPLTFEGLRVYLSEHDYEGIVWHHEDGRMAKIKARDFGIRRPKS